MTVHLNLSSRLWTLQLLGFEVRLQKKATSTVFIKIHKGMIFDLSKINIFVVCQNFQPLHGQAKLEKN
jgi:hypothetical protein